MPKKNLKKVIVIGGSDPSGGAGIQADLFTLQCLNVPAASVITAITAQNEKRFFSYEVTSPQSFRNQLLSVSTFAKRSIVKIGMLANASLLPILEKWLKEVSPTSIILDPVIHASTDYPLLDPQGIALLKERLILLVDLITPNLSELSFLSGMTINSLEGMAKAGIKILEKSAQKKSRLHSILAKGGHLKKEAIDLLITKKSIDAFGKKRISSRDVHGTGCTLASAIAGYLYQGKKLKEAIQLARQVVLEKINGMTLRASPGAKTSR